MSETNLDKKIINLINIYNSSDYNSAILLANELIEKKINQSMVYNILGASLSSVNQHNQAIEAYNAAVLIDPKNEELYRNLGKSLSFIDKDDQAIKAFEKAIELKNNNDDSFFNIGLIFLKKNNFNKSIHYFNLAIEKNNKFFQAYYNLGIIYSKQGDLNLASTFYLKAIGVNKNYYKALNNLGSIYIKLKLTNEAILQLQNAIKVKPDYVEALSNLGVAYMEIKKYNIALSYFDKALAVDSNFTPAIVQKIFINRKICNWSDESFLENNLKLINSETKPLTPWQLLSLEDDPEKEFKRAVRYAKLFSLKSKKIENYNNSKIRIGYFTPDFFNHAGMMNMEGIFKYYNKEKFEIYGFDYGVNNNDETHNRIKKYFDQFYYINDYSDYDVAKLAKENKIDIAIHRNGYSQNARTNIFSYRVAPLQVNFLGYQGTTGLDFIDYIVADNVVIPKDNQKFYSEKIIYLPNSYYPTYNGRSISKKMFHRKSVGIEEDAFVFCSFNNSYKISSKEFNIWMRLLDKCKGSYLLLLVNDEETKKNLLSEVNKTNTNPNKIKFLNFINIEDHLARHNLADLYLDTFNYNGHTSVIDALYAGLPVITKLGNSFAARVCGSILNSFAMEHMVTNNENEYEQLALEIFHNVELFEKIKKEVKKNRLSTDLFNTEKYVCNLEKAFLLAHENKKNKNIIENIYL